LLQYSCPLLLLLCCITENVTPLKWTNTLSTPGRARAASDGHLQNLSFPPPLASLRLSQFISGVPSATPFFFHPPVQVLRTVRDLIARYYLPPPSPGEPPYSHRFSVRKEQRAPRALQKVISKPSPHEPSPFRPLILELRPYGAPPHDGRFQAISNFKPPPHLLLSRPAAPALLCGKFCLLPF